MSITKMMFSNLLILLAVVTLTYGQNGNGSVGRSDSYITENRRRYDAIVRDDDLQMHLLEELYAARINTIDIQGKMLVITLQQTHTHLYPLERLSDPSKTCVHKYQNLLPEVNATRVNVNICSAEANNQIGYLVSGPQETRNNLANYYENTFETEMRNCENNYSNTDLDYTLCVTNVVSNADIFTIGNQEAFALQMDSASLLADAYVHQALECSFAIQGDSVSLIAEANTLIDRCLQGLDDCVKCTGHFCENVLYMPGHTIDYKNETMPNPFLGRNDTIHCLILNVLY